MKKQVYTYIIYPLILVLLVLVLPLLKSRPEHNLDSMLFVKAMLFDKKDGEYALFVYSTDAESGKEQFLYGSGKDVSSAVKSAEGGAYKNLFFPSAELLLLGDGITESDFLSLTQYAVKAPEFPLSVSVFRGGAELSSAKFETVIDAVKAHGIGGKSRLWKQAELLLDEEKAPFLLRVREDESGKIYFEVDGLWKTS